MPPGSNVRLSGTDIVKVSGSTWEFSEPGTYIFEIVEFPVKHKEEVSATDSFDIDWGRRML